MLAPRLVLVCTLLIACFQLAACSDGSSPSGAAGQGGASGVDGNGHSGSGGESGQGGTSGQGGEGGTSGQGGESGAGGQGGQGGTGGTCTPSGADQDCDGVDDDCDGEPDDDYVARVTSCGVGACAATGATSCVDGEELDSCAPGAPAASDATCDGVDDDCSGAADEDYVAVSCGLGVCTRSSSCNSGVETACSAGSATGDDTDCDGIDQDCDGTADDGYVAITCGLGVCARSSSCDGGVETACSAGSATGDDADCDGVDQDCDGTADDGYVATTCGVGACASSSSCDAGIETACSAGAATGDDTDCDGVDDDCDESSDESYVATTCGLGVCASTSSCSDGVETTCSAGSATGDDVDCDGVDQDCDGTADDGYVPTSCGLGVCASTSSCSDGEETACSAGSATGDDADCDGVDQDCDGTADEGYVPTSCGLGVCARSSSCSDGIETTCSAGSATGDDTDCDGVDQNCDGTADDGYAPQSTSCGVGACAATGTTSCVDGDVLDSCTAGTPGPSDADCDGVDDDCNGTPDDGYVPVSTQCGQGACARAGVTSCVDGEVLDSCTAGTPAGDDGTCDAVDDDCDGFDDEDYVGCFDGTAVGSCVDGEVVGSFQCNDGFDCTSDTCVPDTGSCDFAPNNAACSDDGYSCTREVCAPTSSSPASGCQTIEVDADCPDGSFCNGSEVCDPARTSGAFGATGCATALAEDVPCQASNDIDGFACTDTVCVEDAAPNTGHCESDANDDNCDNLAFCDGIEVCSPSAPGADEGGCVYPPSSCDTAELPACALPTCDDDLDACGAVVNLAYNCGDGDPCTTNSCNPLADPSLNPTGCESVPVPVCVGCQANEDCVDTHSCTVDTCLPDNTCENDRTACECLTNTECDDGVPCTTDTCGADGQCVHAASDTFCVNADLPAGLCDGTDVCSPGALGADGNGCLNDVDVPACDDGLTCTVDDCDAQLGCTHMPDDLFCEQQDTLECDGIAYCNIDADPLSNATGCENPAGYDPCPEDGIGCTQELCVEPTDTLPLRCVTQPDNDWCVANGPCGTTCQVGIGCTNACVPATCQGKTYACGDCLDNDGDCRIDTASDDSCLGPCSDNEAGYDGMIAGQNNAPCKMDCYFDQDTGAGNDGCYWSHSCDPLSVAPSYPPSGSSQCEYSPTAKIPGTQLDCSTAQLSQSTQCWDSVDPVASGDNYCGKLVPNGCDCFGCCEIPGLAYAVYLGSQDSGGNGTCTPDTLQDPNLCKPCTQVDSCRNTCGNCEICVGKPTLPPECTCQECAPGVQLCGEPCGTPCQDGFFCSTGCCVPVPD